MKKTAAVSKVVPTTSGFIKTRTSTMALVFVAALFVFSGAISTANANPTCIENCAQCVKMYGEFFDGHSCAVTCMRSMFDAHVDCADSNTISRFFKY